MSRKAETPICGVPDSLKSETPLYKLRHAVGVTIIEVSLAIGINNGNLSKLERGLNRASPDTAAALVAYYKGAINELHLIYPERFPDWQPDPALVASLKNPRNSA